jgi:hypothetical protein
VACAELGGVALPSSIKPALDMLSGSAVPCALLSLGASAASLQPAHWTGTGAIVLAKLVLLSLGVTPLAVFVFHLPVTAAMVLVVLASCPVGINATFVVKPASGGAQVVNSAILLSSLLCVATIPTLLWVLRHV